MSLTDHSNEKKGFIDPLAKCLSIISLIEKDPLSVDAITAGLPIDGQLSPKLFIRAAERAGYSANFIQGDINQLTSGILPAILLLNEMNACVVTEIKEDGTVDITLADAESTQQCVSIEELQENYSGYSILLQKQPQAQLESTETINNKNWFLNAVKKSWKLYVEVVLASILINVFVIVMPLFVMNVYDRVVPHNAIETLWVLASGVMIIIAFDMIIKSLRSYFIDTAGKRTDIILSGQIYEHVMGIQLAAKPASTGSFANNLQEFESFRDFFTSSTLTTLIDLPFVILFLLVIYSIAGDLVFIPIVAIPAILLSGILLQIPVKSIIKKIYQLSARKHSTLIESISGLEAIKTLGGEGHFQKRWEHDVAELAHLGQRSRLINSISMNLSQLIQQLAYVGVVIYGVSVIASGNLTIGGLIACTILTGRSLAPMNNVSNLITRFHQSVNAYHTINQILSMPDERPQGKSFLNKSTISGDIEFKNVSFSYPGQENAILNDISFHIKAGERVAFIGKIGSGKSTIQKLILGLYQASTGSILIDNTDMRQIDPVTLRRSIGYVPQEIKLFQGSIRDNITFGTPPVDDEQILSACQMSGISDFINQHPNGLDYALAEQGQGLSGGQRQLITISRALLLDPSVYIFDEPTNALDNSTEEQLKTRLTDHLSNKTFLLVTHKVSPLDLVDRIIVLDQGRIVLDGPKEQVIQALSTNMDNNHG